MSKAYQLGGVWLIAGLYLAIMIESATVGLLFHATLAEMIDHSHMRVVDRSSSTVIILTFVIVSLIGYTLTIPCLCYAAQRHSPSALIPYLVWRMLFSIIISIIVLWQALEKTKRTAFYRAAFYDKRFPVAIGEITIGFIFFLIALRAHKEFTVQRIRREKTPEHDRFD